MSPAWWIILWASSCWCNKCTVEFNWWDYSSARKVIKHYSFVLGNTGVFLTRCSQWLQTLSLFIPHHTRTRWRHVHLMVTKQGFSFMVDSFLLSLSGDTMITAIYYRFKQINTLPQVPKSVRKLNCSLTLPWNLCPDVAISSHHLTKQDVLWGSLLHSLNLL